MLTQIRKIDENSLALAKKYLFEGEAIGLPTETVYGLGADARSDAAVDRIYRIKGRPQDNPLIVHVHKDFDISSLVCSVQPYVSALQRAFLPGPLTLVYKSRGTVSSKVSCGLDTLAIRVPSHPGAQELLRYVDIPIAAPSANRSKHISPVSALHVFKDLNGKIPLILDGGVCTGGIESTVCDVTGPYPIILRSGLVTQEMIREVAGKCELYVPKAGEPVRSPGLKYKHYAPSCRTHLFTCEQVDKALDALQSNLRDGSRVRVLCEHRISSSFPSMYVLDLGNQEEEMAERLYHLLHVAEEEADVLIAIEPQKKDGVMVGVLNRMRKACAEE